LTCAIVGSFRRMVSRASKWYPALRGAFLR
jgi:hypothetical protein